MTTGTNIQCDCVNCPGNKNGTPAIAYYGENESFPENWYEIGDYDGADHVVHLCPNCADYIIGGLLSGERRFLLGNMLEVQHRIVDDDYEKVSVHADEGTHSFGIMNLIDEPPRNFPDFDHDKDEGWVFTINDHLTMYIIGRHKDNPEIIVRSDEFPTNVRLWDLEDSFSLPAYESMCREFMQERRAYDSDERRAFMDGVGVMLDFMTMKDEDIHKTYMKEEA